LQKPGRPVSGYAEGRTSEDKRASRSQDDKQSNDYISNTAPLQVFSPILWGILPALIPKTKNRDPSKLESRRLSA
jgi:hypothetical protein